MAVHIYSLASNPNTVVHSFRTSNPCRPQSVTQQQAESSHLYHVYRVKSVPLKEKGMVNSS
jgi:hypothetical protein